MELLYRLLKNINVFDEEMITTNTLKTAYDLIKDIDENDMIFVALTIEVDGLLWTGDKKLIKGLNKKGFKKIFNYRDLTDDKEEVD